MSKLSCYRENADFIRVGASGAPLLSANHNAGQTAKSCCPNAGPKVGPAKDDVGLAIFVPTSKVISRARQEPTSS